MNIPVVTDCFDLEYFFELSPDLLCISGYDGYFKKINSAVSKTLGYTKDELFANPIDSFIHVDDRLVTAHKRDLIIKNTPLLNFENRYMTKSGGIVWLAWTSMPIERERVVFAIAKDVTYRKRLEEYRRISLLLNSSQKNESVSEYSPADQLFLSQFEALVRKYTGKIGLSIHMLSDEMAISERQLFRRIKAIMGVTPNQYVRIIRLQLAMEAIGTGKFRTVTEVSHAAGFETASYFSKLFKEIYCQDVGDLL